MFKQLRTGLCLLLALASGCASFHQGDIHASAPSVGTDGVYTVVRGRALRPNEALDYYRAKGADEAVRLQEKAIHDYRQAKSWFFKDLIGGIVLGGGAMLIYTQTGETYMRQSDWAAFATAAGIVFGAIAGFVVGGLHSTIARSGSPSGFQAAARAYNASLPAPPPLQDAP